MLHISGICLHRSFHTYLRCEASDHKLVHTFPGNYIAVVNRFRSANPLCTAFSSNVKLVTPFLLYKLHFPFAQNSVDSCLTINQELKRFQMLTEKYSLFQNKSDTQEYNSCIHHCITHLRWMPLIQRLLNTIAQTHPIHSSPTIFCWRPLSDKAANGSSS